MKLRAEFRTLRRRGMTVMRGVAAPAVIVRRIVLHLPVRCASALRGLVRGTQAGELPRLQTILPELYRDLSTEAICRANRVLSGNYEILWFQVNLTGTIDWHRDPRSQHRWARAFYADLDFYELPAGIDVKYVWELNRHQFLVELSRGWMFTHDDRFGARARELILDWIDNNPLYEGVNLTSRSRSCRSGDVLAVDLGGVG